MGVSVFQLELISIFSLLLSWNKLFFSIDFEFFFLVFSFFFPYHHSFCSLNAAQYVDPSGGWESFMFSFRSMWRLSSWSMVLMVKSRFQRLRTGILRGSIWKNEKKSMSITAKENSSKFMALTAWDKTTISIKPEIIVHCALKWLWQYLSYYLRWKHGWSFFLCLYKKTK